MRAIKVIITKLICDESFPEIVECEFKDVHGTLWKFSDKRPVFTYSNQFPTSVYRQPGVIACKIIDQKEVNGEQVFTVKTTPWRLADNYHEHSQFEVIANDLTETESPVS